MSPFRPFLSSMRVFCIIKSTMKKVLFFDIDGTIYREGYGVYDSAADALRRCARNGHLLMLCTGRGASSIPDEVTELPFSGGVFGCGTYVYADGRVLTDAALLGSACGEVVDILYKNRCPFFINNSDYIYYDPSYIAEGFRDKIQKMNYAYHGRLRTLSELDGRISKLTAYPEDRSLIPQIARELSPWFDCIEYTEYQYIELTLKGYSKGTGVDLVLKELNLTREQSYGFGDSGNDLPMLEAVGRGIVMGEAPRHLQDRFISTGSIHQDGLADVLARLDLI